MAIRFKFRSSVDFEYVVIGEKPSISLRDLKSNILRQKNLTICHNFDLVFSDALTGQEYIKEDVQIPNGSCVIIKRMPVGTTHSDMVQFVSFKDFQGRPTKIVNSSPPVTVDMNELDDFGADLYSAPGKTTSPYDIDIDLRIQGDKTHIDSERFSEPYKGDFHKVVSDLSEDIAVGPPHAGIERNASETKIKTESEHHTKLEKVIEAISPSLQKIDLPPELKCSICVSFLKDATMIPCCQHSFCERCIRLSLVEKGACPKCYSSKCTVEDLLPNVSLRQAVVHFLEYYILTTGSHNASFQYAPDGGSEAYAKDVSHNVPTHQKETDLPHSPLATETGSNEIIGEAAHDLLFKENASLGCIGSHFSHLGKCQHINEEVESINKEKRRPRVNVADSGGDKRLMDARRHKKGNITCYICGSPDHLIRRCPATSSPYFMQQRGNTMLPRPMPPSISPYWNATFFHHAGPFTSLYENHGVMPFKMPVFPRGYCAFPFMHSLYGSMPSFSGLTEIACVAYPLGANRDHQPRGSQLLDFQNHNKSQKLSNDSFRRENSFDDDDDDCIKRSLYKQTENSYHKKSYLFRERSASVIHERQPQCQKREQGCHNLMDDVIVSVDEKNSFSSIGTRGQWSCWHLEQSSSEVEDFPCSSHRCSEERNKQHNRGSKREIERDDLGVENNCVQGHQFYEVKRKRGTPYTKRSHCKRYGHSKFDLEQSLSSDDIRQQKLTAHDSRYSKQRIKSVDDELVHNRWQMGSGLDYSDKENWYDYKRKRAR